MADVLDTMGDAVAPGPGTVPVIELDTARLSRAGDLEEAGVEVSLCLGPGESVMVRAASVEEGTLLADAACGTLDPGDGRACFLGHDWQDLEMDDVNALRSLIGRVFSRDSWLDELDIADNVLLPHLHHSHVERERLEEDAARLARAFGLPGLPRAMPRGADAVELQRAACVRAFLGTPRLVIVEQASAIGGLHLLSAAANAIRAACSRGAAVLWITASERAWRESVIPVDRRLRVAHRRLDAGATAQGVGP